MPFDETIVILLMHHQIQSLTETNKTNILYYSFITKLV